MRLLVATVLQLLTLAATRCSDQTWTEPEGSFQIETIDQKCSYHIDIDEGIWQVVRSLTLDVTAEDRCQFIVYKGTIESCSLKKWDTYGNESVRVIDDDGLDRGTVKLVASPVEGLPCTNVRVNWTSHTVSGEAPEFLASLIIANAMLSPFLIAFSFVGTIFVGFRHETHFSFGSCLRLAAFLLNPWRCLYLFFTVLAAALYIPSAAMLPFNVYMMVDAMIIGLAIVHNSTLYLYAEDASNTEVLMDMALIWTPLKELKPSWMESEGGMIWPIFEIVSAIVTWIGVALSPGNRGNTSTVLMFIAAAIETIGSVLIIQVSLADRKRIFKSKKLETVVKSSSSLVATGIACFSYVGDVVAMVSICFFAFSCPLTPILYFTAAKAVIFNLIRGFHVSILYTWYLLSIQFWRDELETHAGNTELTPLAVDESTP